METVTNIPVTFPNTQTGDNKPLNPQPTQPVILPPGPIPTAPAPEKPKE